MLDPTTTEGRRVLTALVDTADIVIEASRPRALTRFGLDAPAAVARGATWVSITAAGRSSNRIGFGDDLAATAGLVASDSHGTPLFVGDYGRPTHRDHRRAPRDVRTRRPVGTALGPVDVPPRRRRPHRPVCAPSLPTQERLGGRHLLRYRADRRAATRTPDGSPAPSGADIAAVLASLGIAAP